MPGQKQPRKGGGTRSLKRYGCLLSIGFLLTVSFWSPAVAQEGNQLTGSSADEIRALSLFTVDALSNARSIFGFSVNASQFYTSNLYTAGQPPLPVRVTALAPRAFVNIGNKRSRLHMNYGFSYRISDKYRELDSSEHSAHVIYNHQIARRVEIQFSDRATYTTDDTFYNLFNSYKNASVLPETTPESQYEVLQLRQRIVRNTIKGEINFQFGRKTNIRFFGSHFLYRYSGYLANDTSAIQVGTRYERQINKWFSISSAYSDYLNTVDPRLEDSHIHRLEAGGLNFKLGRYWSCYTSGGAEYADTRGFHQISGSARGSLTRKSEHNVFSMNYQRGFASAIGTNRIFPSQSLTVEMEQQLSRRVRMQIAGTYIRSEDFFSPGILDSRLANARIEVLIRNDVIMSANYSYQNQKNGISGLNDVLNIDRSTVFIGMQYQWPSLRP